MKSTSTRDFPNFIISKATVITNLLSPFPSLIEWLCGGHYVYNPTLKRFFLFHFLFPFLLCVSSLVLAVPPTQGALRSGLPAVRELSGSYSRSVLRCGP